MKMTMGSKNWQDRLRRELERVRYEPVFTVTVGDVEILCETVMPTRTLKIYHPNGRVIELENWRWDRQQESRLYGILLDIIKEVKNEGESDMPDR